MESLDRQIDVACPACGHKGMAGLHLEPAVPVNSNLLLDNADDAKAFPRGVIDLGRCPRCGFISNVAFDATLARYGEGYEETQGFSTHFRRFAAELAAGWIERYDLVGKQVLEIGCGKGEFLTMMAEAGIGHGIGIDPGVKVERIDSPAADRLEWLPRYFTRTDVDLIGDAVVCRHTLEHIHPVYEFVSGLRSVIGDRLDTVVLFELPDVQRVLNEVAFWDVYYEHCAYFTQGSLARLFERAGFEVLDLRLEYDGQYIIIEARPVAAGVSVEPWSFDDMDAIAAGAEHFAAGYAATVGEWADRLAELSAGGGIATVWGASSKAVSFLGPTGDHVAVAVDINPHKHGTFMAGTGHPVVAPEDLVAVNPDLVIAMNPIYLAEIQADLDRVGVRSDLIAL